MITTPEIVCDVFSFLDKDRIEQIQLVNQLWNNVIIYHKNIWPLRQFVFLKLHPDQIVLNATREELFEYLLSYIIQFDGTNLTQTTSIKFGKYVPSPYSHLTVDEVLNNLNDVVFDCIQIEYCYSEGRLDYLLNLLKLVTTKTGGRIRGRFGHCDA